MTPFHQMTPLRRLLWLGGMAKAAGGKAVEDTATGNPLTFTTDLARPLPRLVANFLPVQSGTGEPSPENVRPITGWTGATVKHSNGYVSIYGFSASNVNGHNKSNFSLSNSYGTTISAKEIPYPSDVLEVEQTQYPETSTPSSYKNGYFCIIIDDTGLENKNVTVKMDVDVKNNPLNVDYLHIYTNGTGGAKAEIVNGKIEKTLKYVRHGTFTERTLFEVRNCGMSIEISNIEITLEDAETDAYPVTWSDSGTAYGGYVDLITGEVWKTWEQKTLVPNGWGLNDANELNKSDVTGSINSSATVNVYCDHFKGVTRNELYTHKEDNNVQECSVSNGTVRIISRTNGANNFTVNDFNEYLTENAVVIAYRLAAPVLVTTISPAEIIAIVGNNTVWSDANGDCEVTFLKKE